MKKIAIVGGGASGMMACLSILENNAKEQNTPPFRHPSTEGNGAVEVTLFEKNTSLGAKVIISGGGRCNLTTGIDNKKVLLSKYTRGADFIKFALGKYHNKSKKS